MQIQSLYIDHKKCLTDFKIEFHTRPHSSTTILIGDNGTGKSTMMEAILEILMSFDSPAIEKKIDYSYILSYTYAQKYIMLRKMEKEYEILVDGYFFQGSYVQAQTFLKEHRLFPKRIISFYSGANNKLEPLIRNMNAKYKEAYRKVLRGYLHITEHIGYYDPPAIPVRKYNYCDEHMVPIYLCSILAGQHSYEKRYLQKECGFGEVIRIDMSIDLSKVAKLFSGGKNRENDLHQMMISAEYIDQNLCGLLHRGYRFSTSTKAYFELEGLMEYESDSVAILEFFEILHDLFGAQYEVYATIGGHAVNTKDLSEGQRQLIKVLGMLGICKNEDCLILMDEPDAHMNPKWKYGLKKMMAGCLSAAQNTQAIIATHDPLVINGVDKEFIRIFAYDNALAEYNGVRHTKVIVPTVDTKGMGIDGLLQSQYYGLSTTLDEDTQSLMEEKRNLMVKRRHGDFTTLDRRRLHQITDQLEQLTFTRNIPVDNYYDEFVVAMHSIYGEQPKPVLTAEEIDERNKKARQIMEKLLKR